MGGCRGIVVFPVVTNTGGGGGGSGTLAQDWIDRSTATGVVQAIRFASSTPVSTYVHPDGSAGNVTWDSTDGVIGDGCLKIAVPASSGANPGGWRAPLNSSWTTDGQGFGSTRHYIQYRVKLGPNRLLESTGGGGFKVSILGEYKFSSPGSSGSHTSCEIVVNNQNWRGILFAYREHPVTGTTGFDITDGVGIHLQTAVDRGAGESDNNRRYALYESGLSSVGGWHWPEEEWVTVYEVIKIVDYGGTGTGNEIDIYAARDGDTAYTHLYNNRDFRIGSDALVPNGNNGKWFTPYDTNRTSHFVDTWHKYDQLIVSTSPIAVPVSSTSKPTWIGASDYAWFNTAAQIQDAQTYTEPAGLAHASICAYSGAAKIGSKLYFAGGGHGDGAANAIISMDLSANSPAASLERGPTASVTADVSHYADGRPSSRHTGWEIQGIASRNRVFFFGAWALYGVAIATNKVDAFDISGGDYDADGTWASQSGLQSGNAPNGVCQDNDGNVYVLCNGNNNLYKWTNSSATWSTLISGTITNEYDSPMAYDPVRHRLVIAHATLGKYVNLSNNAVTNITWAGSASAQVSKGASLFWCQDIGRFLFKKYASSTIYSIHPTTYAAEPFAVTGTAPTEGGGGYSNVYNRIGWIKELGIVYYVSHYNTNLSGFRLARWR